MPQMAWCSSTIWQTQGIDQIPGESINLIPSASYFPTQTFSGMFNPAVLMPPFHYANNGIQWGPARRQLYQFVGKANAAANGVWTLRVENYDFNANNNNFKWRSE